MVANVLSGDTRLTLGDAIPTCMRRKFEETRKRQ